jgi:hypothetical protein
MPPDLDPASIDIIDGLLNLNISQRYGCGAPGSTNDIKSLKQHPFFASIDFEKI